MNESRRKEKNRKLKYGYRRFLLYSEDIAYAYIKCVIMVSALPTGYKATKRPALYAYMCQKTECEDYFLFQDWN